MGCLAAMCRSFFTVFNGLVVMTGLAIVGIAIYFAVEQAQNGIFGSFSVWAIWVPLALGLFTTIMACCGCFMQWHEKGRLLFCYAMVLFLFGAIVAGAGATQIALVGYQEVISQTADLSTLEAGFRNTRRILSDYDLGIYNLCCLQNSTANYDACAVVKTGLCYFDKEIFDLALGEDAEFCNRVTALELCPDPSGVKDVQEFNENLFVYVNDTFLYAAYALSTFGGILLLTCLGACQAGSRNRQEAYKS